MTCEEMIYSNDYSDYNINFLEGFEGAEEIYRTGCVNVINSKIAILHMPRKEDYLTLLERTPYSYIPKLFGQMDSSNIEAIGVKKVQNANNLSLGGKNVIVGVIDTGIDYQNPLFLDNSGKSRIGVIWDQTINELEKSDENLNAYYGAVYTKSQINQALGGSEPYEIVPSRDENGHGTFLAGIAAGGQNQENDFKGIADQSEIAVVKLKKAKPYLKHFFGVPEEKDAYSETDIIYAVDFLYRYAQSRNRPVSILIGVGSSNGGHLGHTFLEQYLALLLENAGIMVSAPAGNEGSERLHYSGGLEENEEYETVELNVGEEQKSLTLELWGKPPTTFALGIISPQGEQLERIPPRFGQEEVIQLPLSRSEIYVAYQMVEIYTGEELIFVRLTNPTPGIWTFQVYTDEGKRRNFNIWLPIRQFLQTDTYFLNANPENTITVPGNAPVVMTMTAYNHLNGSIYANAGRGYVMGHRVKPDLAAPGVNVFGPGLRNRFVTKSGTSVAAAHSAGIMALFLQWNIEHPEFGYFYATQIQSFFRKSAVRQTQDMYPNSVWGYGIINMERVFDQFRFAYPGNYTLLNILD